MSAQQFRENEGSFLKTAKSNSNSSLPIGISVSKINVNIGRESDELQVDSDHGALSTVYESPSLRFYSNDDKELGQQIKQSSSEQISQIGSINKSVNKISTNHSKNTYSSTVKHEENPELNKHIDFVDTRSVQSDETNSVNYSTASENYLYSPSLVDTKYYINYEGKLSLRTKVKTGQVVEKFKEIGKSFKIVSSILNEIIFKLDVENKTRSITEKSLLQTAPSVFPTDTAHSSMYVSIKDIIQKQKEKKRQAEDVKTINGTMECLIPQMSLIVRHLGLPITLSQTQPYLDIRADFERVLTEKDVSTGKLLSSENDPTTGKESECDYKQLLEEKKVLEAEVELVDSPFVSFNPTVFLCFFD